MSHNAAASSSFPDALKDGILYTIESEIWDQKMASEAFVNTTATTGEGTRLLLVSLSLGHENITNYMDIISVMVEEAKFRDAVRSRAAYRVVKARLMTTQQKSNMLEQIADDQAKLRDNAEMMGTILWIGQELLDTLEQCERLGLQLLEKQEDMGEEMLTNQNMLLYLRIAIICLNNVWAKIQNFRKLMVAALGAAEEPVTYLRGEEELVGQIRHGDVDAVSITMTVDGVLKLENDTPIVAEMD